MVSDELLQRLQNAVDDLQSRVSFQEQALAELEEIVSGQDQLLMRQQRQLHLLGGEMKLLEGRLERDGAPEAEQPPPHY